jgi:hypothetical protein
MPVSVEDIEGYVEQAKRILGEKADLMPIFLLLAQKVHPLVLGNAFRARAQIRRLGERLISNHIQDEKKIKTILDFLCSESGSHDYTISRREAKDILGLPVEKPSRELYEIIKSVYEDFSRELKLTQSFNPHSILQTDDEAPYRESRALIESISGGGHTFISEGTFIRKALPTSEGGQIGIEDQRTKEEWEWSPNRGLEP